MKPECVTGYLFTADGGCVVLIRKGPGAPQWARGRLLGLGGKVNPDEPAALAMLREGREEAGVSPAWRLFGVLRRPAVDVWLFRAFDDEAAAAAATSSPEGQVECWVTQAALASPDLLPDGRWTIPAALDPKVIHLSARARAVEDCA